MTNSMASNDEPFASAAYGRYRVPMLKLGVNLYEIDSSQLKNDTLFGGILRQSIGRSHSKIVLIDDHITFVGSMNMDFRSALANTELGMLIESPELASDLLDLSARLRAGAYRLRLAQPGDKVQWIGTVNNAEKVYEDEPGVGFGTRLELLLFPFISENLL
jgi:putative cardiolipin synthase